MTPLLDRYREAGYAISREGNGLRVEAEHPVSDRMREVFRQKKAELFKELSVEGADLDSYRHALWLGTLVVCGNCRHFQFADDPAELGQCRCFAVEAWPFVPFPCSGFEPGAAPAAPDYLPDADGSRAVERSLRGWYGQLAKGRPC